MTKQTGVEVKLTGTDGNIFALMGRVSSALKRAGFSQEASEMQDRVINAESYNDALSIFMEYVEVS